MTKDEALQMCLEYIETNAHERRHVRWAIKEALAQLEQKPKICEAKQQCLRGLPCMCVAHAPRPVAWGVDWGRAGETPCVSITKRLPDGGIEVLAVEYGPPRPWVGLTDREKMMCRSYDPEEAVAKTEAKLKELNT